MLQDVKYVESQNKDPEIKESQSKDSESKDSRNNETIPREEALERKERKDFLPPVPIAAAAPAKAATKASATTKKASARTVIFKLRNRRKVIEKST